MIDRNTAREILRRCGAPIDNDQFHALNSDVVQALLRYADLHKYRKPRNANGSRARYFHAYLQRRAASQERGRRP